MVYTHVNTLKYWIQSWRLVTKRFGFIQILEARMGSKTCRFQQIFEHRNMELLLLFSIISPYSVIVKIVCLQIKYIYQSTFRFLDSSSSENMWSFMEKLLQFKLLLCCCGRPQIHNSSNCSHSKESVVVAAPPALKVIKAFQVNISWNFSGWEQMFSSENLKSFVGKPFQDLLNIYCLYFKFIKLKTD